MKYLRLFVMVATLVILLVLNGFAPLGSSLAQDDFETYVHRISKSGDGKVIAVSYAFCDGACTTVDLFDSQTGQLIETVDLAPISPRIIVLDMTGDRIAYSTDYEIGYYDRITNTRTTLNFIQSSKWFAWDPLNSNWLAIADGNALLVIDLATNDFVADMRATYGLISRFQSSPDGQYIASTQSGRINIWSRSNFNPNTVLSTPAHDLVRGGIMDWHPDSTKLAMLEPNTLLIYDAILGQFVQDISFSEEIPYAVKWSPDGSKIATGGETLRIWDTSTWQVIEEYTYEGTVGNLEWSLDGEHIFHDGTDGLYRDGDSVRFLANAGNPQTVTTATSTASVTLDGSESFDVDGTIVSYTWTDASGNQLGSGVSPTVNLPVGINTVTLTVTNANGTTATDDVVITVQSSIPCNTTTPASDTTALIDAITCANSAGSPQTITLGGGTYTLSAVQNSDAEGANGLPVITGDITIVGNGATVTRDAAASAFRLFNVAQGASLSLSNLTLSNGYLDAGFNGGGILNNGTLNIAASNITGNTAGGLGGGVYNTGTITSDGSGIHGNTSGQDGGGLYNTGSFTITNGGLFGNSASGNGGAIFNTGSASVSLFNSGMENNTAPNGQGGAIYNEGASFTLSSSGLYNNTSGLDGAGVYNTGGFTVVSSGIGSNTSGLNGGGVFNSGTLNVTYSSLNSNTVAGSGGGLYQSASGVLTLSDGEMNLNNASSGLGAGLYNEGSLNLSHAGFGSNVTNFDGAGIYSSGTLAGDNLSITYNTTGNLGGGLYNDGTFTLTLVTFNNNQSSTGGALYTTTAANNSVTQSCVTNNIATDTSGIFSDVAPLQADSIWWGAADGPSGAGSGTGDAVNGNVTYQPFWTEGCGTSGSQSLTQTSQQSSTDSTSQNSSEVVPPFRSQIQNANNWRADSAWTFGSNVGRQGGGWTIRAAKASDQSNLEFNRRFNLRNTTNPRLSFMQKANLAPYDTIIVEVQPQFSRGWIPLDRQQGLETDWQLREIDLSAYRGQSIRLRWRILTTGLTPQAETQDGFWLDDLAVEDVR